MARLTSATGMVTGCVSLRVMESGDTVKSARRHRVEGRSDVHRDEGRTDGRTDGLSPLSVATPVSSGPRGDAVSCPYCSSIWDTQRGFDQYFLFFSRPCLRHSGVFLDQGTLKKTLELSPMSRMTPNKGLGAPSVSCCSDRASGMSRACLKQTNT